MKEEAGKERATASCPPRTALMRPLFSEILVALTD